MFDSYIRKAEVRKVINADTIEVLLDFGFDQYSVQRILLSEANAPEPYGEEKEKGILAKEYVEKLIPEGSIVYIKSYKKDSFGRWIASIYYKQNNGWTSLSETLLINKFAVPHK